MINIFAVVMLVILLDQFSKYIVQFFLIPNATFPVLKGFFYLTLVYNKGAAFGFFKEGTSILIFFSFLCIFIIMLLLKRNAFLRHFFGIDIDRWPIRFALSLILGGAFGNLIDRVRYGYVVDFLDFHLSSVLAWPVFNFADSAITIGGVILFLNIIKHERKDNL